GTKVQQPDIVASCVEEFEQVRLGHVGREDQARDSQPVRKNHRSFIPAAVSRQAQWNVVFGNERVNLERADAQRTLLARRSGGIESGRSCKNAAVALPQNAREERTEPRDRIQLLLAILRVR